MSYVIARALAYANTGTSHEQLLRDVAHPMFATRSLFHTQAPRAAGAAAGRCCHVAPQQSQHAHFQRNETVPTRPSAVRDSLADVRPIGSLFRLLSLAPTLELARTLAIASDCANHGAAADAVDELVRFASVCSRIETLDLSAFGAGVPVAHRWAEFPRLRVLALSQTTPLSRTAGGVGWISSLSRLTTLTARLDAAGFDMAMSCLRYVSTLEHLSLSGCNTGTDAGFAHLAQLRLLHSLELRDCYYVTDRGIDAGITGLQLDGLSPRLPRLRTLLLWHCDEAGDPSLRGIARLSQLESLSLREWGQRLTDSGLRHLGGLKHLCRLEAGELLSASNLGLTYLLRLAASVGAAPLEELALDGCAHVSGGGDFFAELGRGAALRCLSIRGSRNLVEDFFLGLLPLRASLRRLDLTRSFVTDEAMAVIGKFAELEELLLVWCNEITDDGICSLRAMPRLRLLNLCGCQDLTDKAIESISDRLADSLEVLDIRGSYCRTRSLISDKGVSLLRAKCRALRHLIADAGYKCELRHGVWCDVAGRERVHRPRTLRKRDGDGCCILA